MGRIPHTKPNIHRILRIPPTSTQLHTKKTQQQPSIQNTTVKQIKKMQENKIDYSDSDIHCCLNCETAKPGCLCYSCRCTSCYFYTSPEYEDEKGFCDIAREKQNKTKKRQKQIETYFKSKIKDYTIVPVAPGQTRLN